MFVHNKFKINQPCMFTGECAAATMHVLQIFILIHCFLRLQQITYQKTATSHDALGSTLCKFTDLYLYIPTDDCTL